MNKTTTVRYSIFSKIHLKTYVERLLKHFVTQYI